MIEVTEIRPSKSNPDWLVVTVANVIEDDFRSKQNQSAFNNVKQTSFPVMKDKNQFTVGERFANQTIVTQERELPAEPFWPDQEPFEVKDAQGNVVKRAYYRNYIMDKSELK